MSWTDALFFKQTETLRRNAMKDAFRKHGKWLFIPAPILVFTGSAIPIPLLTWIGVTLLCILVTILAIQPKLKRTIIE